MRIDSHMHINGRNINWGWEHNDLIIEAADKLGIDKLAVSIPANRRFPMRDENPFDYNIPTMDEIRQDNDDVLAAMNRYSGRILGYCYVLPGYKESIDEIDRCLDQGMIGIKVYNQYKIWDPVFYPIIEKSIKEKFPILVHAGFATSPEEWDFEPNMSHAADFAYISRLYPEAMIIEGHIGGGGDWEWAIKHLREAPNIYLDTAGSVVDEGMIDMAVRELGAERLLFATDMTMESNVAKIMAADLTDEQRNDIFGRNFQKILDKRGL